MVQVLVEAGARLGLANSLDATGRPITGHSLRPTGAQMLARAGFDPWVIGLLFRWGSQTVLLYLREAPLVHSAKWAGRALQGL